MEAVKKLNQEGQKPQAIVVACADSRVAPEIIMDAKLGEIFVIRVAGNVVGSNELASIEYAALVLEVPLCLVVGHTNCGAVGEAVRCFKENAKSSTPALNSLVDTILPAVKHQASSEDANSDGFLKNSIIANSKNVCQSLIENSDALAQRVSDGKLTIKPALFDMATGALEVFQA